MQNELNRKKVSKITECSKKIKNTIEEFTLTMSVLTSMGMLYFSGFDFATDKSLDIAYNNPTIYFGTVLSPAVIAGLIMTLDKNSTVNEDVKAMIKDLKAKKRVRK